MNELPEDLELFKARDRPVDLVRPLTTYALIAAIVLIYFAESSVYYGVDTPKSNPDRAGLIAMGALSAQLVFHDGQWFRLLTAELLHGGPAHIFLNSLALFCAGSLELFIGAAWFLAIFALSALGASLFSVAFNPAELLSVGASGAILGLFGAQVVIAYLRVPKGKLRSQLTDRAWQILFPTLAAFTTASDGSRLDFAAHLGGTITGLVAGALLTLLWPSGVGRPRAQTLALAINCAAGMVLIYAAVILIAHRAS